MNWLNKLSMGKPLKKSRINPLPIGNIMSDKDMINNFAHEIPARTQTLTPSQVNKFKKDLMKRGYNAAKAKKYANKALNLSKKYMNKPKFPGQSRLYGKFDFDGDGVPNNIDCYPFDKDRKRNVSINIGGRTVSGPVGGKITTRSGVTYTFNDATSRATGGSSSGGGSSGGGSSPAPPKPQSTGALPLKSNPYKPGTANYAKAEAYSKAYAAGDVKGGVVQNPTKYLSSSGGSSSWSGFSGVSSNVSTYSPTKPSYFNIPSSQLTNFKDVSQIEGVSYTPEVKTETKIERIYVDDQSGFKVGRLVKTDENGRKYYEEPYTVDVIGTIGYEPEYGSYVDQAEYEAKRAELIEKILGTVTKDEQSRYDARSNMIDLGLQKRLKKKASLGGPSTLSRRTESLGDYKKRKSAAIANTNLENLRGALYGEQQASEKFKPLVEQSKKDMETIKSNATKSYVTGQKEVRGVIGTESHVKKNWISN